MQRAFSNKVSALPHFMSFKAAPEERPRKIIFDPLASSAFQPIPPTNVFSSNHKPSGVSQSQVCMRPASHFDELYIYIYMHALWKNI